MEAAEAAVLARLAAELLELLGPGQPPDPASADPLAELVGLPPGDAPAPTDPALARLFPAAYSDDPEASREFRRYSQAELVAGKRVAAARVLDDVSPLVATGGRLRLDHDGAWAWLSWLTDIRLVLGSRLGVTEDSYAERVSPEDPRAASLAVFGWLGWLQESLLSRLEPHLG